MEPSDRFDPKKLAAEAAAFGLLSAEDVWEIACRWRDTGGDPGELFAGKLTVPQLAALRRNNRGPVDETVRAVGNDLGDRTIVETDAQFATRRDPAPDLATKRDASNKPTPDVDPNAATARLSQLRPPIPVTEIAIDTPISEPTLNTAFIPATATPSTSSQETQSTDDLRYLLTEELGEGGMGRVVAARDTRIDRTVALKMLRPGVRHFPSALDRFVMEARVTAQLEHPGIIPIYDLGILPDGAPFYTMRVVQRRSLKDVLSTRKSRSEWPLARLAGVFVQVCHAMGYAHARGVIHRDLKPDNILIGDYGEVYVADWGIAKIVGEPEDATRTIAYDGSHEETMMGSALGTPGYMAPEQARGEWDTIDHRADIFALGCVLYVILTGRRPFDVSGSGFSALVATIASEPTAPRLCAPDCPLVLEDLCLKMLAKNPDDRPSSAEVVATEVEAFLEGAKERERRQQEAARLVERARNATTEYIRLREEKNRALADAGRMLEKLELWAPIERKQPAWDAEQRAEQIDHQRVLTCAEALELFARALGYDRDSSDAKAGLADLLWERARESESAGNRADQLYNESLVRQYDDQQRYIPLITARSHVSVASTPTGAHVTVFRYAEHGRLLVAESPTHLGQTPLEVDLDPGSYLFTFACEGVADTRYPVMCRRGETVSIDVRMRTEAEIGEGFVYIPGGPTTLGGDPAAINSLPRMTVEVPDYAMGRFPVTYSEYLEFLNELDRVDPEQAFNRAPHTTTHEDWGVQRDAEGKWEPAWERIIEGPAREFCPPDRAKDLPIESISWFDAMEYCHWLSRRDGVRYRLPTEFEFEKAARGADERYFPWGNGFDPVFCKMRESRPGYPQSEPIGTFEIDQSPYGVRDMAGGVREWLLDLYGEVSVEEALAERELPPHVPRDQASSRMNRGGNWSSPGHLCRVALRVRAFTPTRLSTVGFRLVKEL